jgi:L-fucose mutarotase/ribose pyranase (RbsD/FucU family)
MATSLYTDENSDDQPKKAVAKKPGENTLLDRLRETVSKKVERPVVLVEVPSRDGVYIRISPNITQNQMRAWRRNAGEDSKAGLDPTKFSAYVIGHTTVGFEIDGEEVVDGDGNSMNFASDAILQMTNADRPVPDAVREFFGVDPHLEAAALAILEAAGYGDTVETVDPTRKSSTN